MTQIFCDANVVAQNDSEKSLEAFFVNDENFVFVGKNSEVKSLKTKAVKLLSLDGKLVLPTMFKLDYELFKEACGYENAKKSLITGKNLKASENSDNGCDYKVCLKVFKDFQKTCLENGITTVWARIKSKKEFETWQKIAEENQIKMEVIGIVDFRSAKFVMDENCRSFRKYKGGFRLGGYTVRLDGKLSQKKAWLSKPYKHSCGFLGYNEIVDEELIFIIKTALEEKKQLIVEANGDRAIEQFLNCFDLATEKKEVEDNYKILVECSGLISKKHLIDFQVKNIGVRFNYKDLFQNYFDIKKLIGTKRTNQMLNINNFLNSDIKLLLELFDYNVFETINLLTGNANTAFAKILKKQNLDKFKILNCIIKNAAYYSFEIEQKGSIEAGKKADFAVFSSNGFETTERAKLLQTYIKGKKVFENKK